MSLASLKAACDRNMVGTFEFVADCSGWPLAAGTRRFGNVIAIATGHLFAFYNPVLAMGDHADGPDLEAGVSWIEGLGLRASVVCLRAHWISRRVASSPGSGSSQRGRPARE
jgi:hypothetical protein